MIIFVEGADGAGKTTLVSELKNHYPTLTITRQAQSKYPTMWKDLLAASKDKVLIADRCFISDYIYRLHDLEKGYYCLDDVFYYTKPEDAAIIYCKTDSQFEDSMARGEDNITKKEDANDIKTLYDVIMRIFKKEGRNCMTYNWKEQNVHDVLNFIKTLERRQ